MAAGRSRHGEGNRDPGSHLAAAMSMLDRLTWWGRLLRDARAEGDHPG
ncbi:hypothetical protein [Streptomyces sp. SID14515]|nr:hypothetical protein [Streptomyces sp. SID14515]NEB40675.1 hypothetical protein [Streptomyces sp. SID14515]